MRAVRIAISQLSSRLHSPLPPLTKGEEGKERRVLRAKRAEAGCQWISRCRGAD